MPDIQLRNFPMPPSVNALYSSIGRRRVKSKVYQNYERLVWQWVGQNADQVDLARQTIRGIKHVLHVDAVFYMWSRDIITKEGKPKRNDTSNRLKALHDVLGSIVLGLDDSYFWSGSFHKCAVADKMRIHVDIEMKFMEMDLGGDEDGDRYKEEKSA